MLYVKNMVLIILGEKSYSFADCDLLAKVYINLIDQREPTLNFKTQNENIINKNNVNISYFKKVVKPSVTELKNHRDYLINKLKKNFF